MDSSELLRYATRLLERLGLRYFVTGGSDGSTRRSRLELAPVYARDEATTAGVVERHRREAM